MCVEGGLAACFTHPGPVFSLGQVLHLLWDRQLRSRHHTINVCEDLGCSFELSAGLASAGL